MNDKNCTKITCKQARPLGYVHIIITLKLAQIHCSIRAPASTKQRGSFLTSSISIFISAKRTEPLLPSAWPWKKTKIKKEMIQQATLFLLFEFFFTQFLFFSP